MSDPNITINIDAGWLSRAWACVPKTKDDFKALPGKIIGKIGNSIYWAAYHTQVWLALFVAFVAGAALSPLFRPHLASYNVPMIEAENMAPRTVTISMTKTEQTLNELATRMAKLEQTANAMNATVIATQGVVNSTAGVVDKVSQTTDIVGPLASKLLGGGISIDPAPAAAPIAKPKPAPVAKKVQTAPVAPAPAPAAQPEATGSLIPDWLKKNF